MMNIKLDFRSGIPIYMQVVDQIKEMIASGQLHPGDQLPTVRALALDLRINFNTVARAYRILDEIGFISTQHGRGTYILEMPSPEMLEKVRQQSLEDLTRRFLADADSLGIPHKRLIQVLNEQADKLKNEPSPEEIK
jgi:GntR family transcriptional regulator